MKCRKCGFELTGRFCEHCGEPALVPEPEKEQVQAPKENNNHYVDNDLNSDKNNSNNNDYSNYSNQGPRNGSYNNQNTINNNYTSSRNSNVDFDKALREVPKIVDDMSKSNVWIRGLKIIAGVEFAIIVIASVIIGLGLMSHREGLYGLLVIVLGVFLAFISVALLMVFLNMAEDIAEIRSKLNQKLK